LAGIRLYDSSNNIITGNTLVNDGLSVSLSYQNTVEDNIVNGKPLVYLEDALDYKVERLYFSSNNIISDNNVSNNNWHGIKLDDSSNNIITGNTLVNDGLSVSLSYQNTVEDNIVNGKPLVYLEDALDYKVEYL
jgi:parallel beta-helix repeat protein